MSNSPLRFPFHMISWEVYILNVYKLAVFSNADNACKGDVVLFKRNIYKLGKIVRKKRTIVGRIVEKSYGASNKQHTFTVSDR